MDDAILVPVILGVTEVIKRIGINDKFAPVIAIALGILIKGLFGSWDSGSILSGVIIGLSSVGLYSGTKATILGK